VLLELTGEPLVAPELDEATVELAGVELAGAAEDDAEADPGTDVLLDGDAEADAEMLADEARVKVEVPVRVMVCVMVLGEGDADVAYADDEEPV